MPPELVLEHRDTIGKQGKNADVERAIRQEGQAVMEPIKKRRSGGGFGGQWQGSGPLKGWLECLPVGRWKGVICVS